MTRTLTKSPGAEAIAELRTYLEQSLHFRWNYYSDDHQPTEDADAEFAALGADRIIYQANPKGAIHTYTREQRGSTINASPTTYGNVELGLRVLCSHQEGATVLDELLTIEWELEKLNAALIRGDTQFKVLGLLLTKTEFQKVIQSHDGGNGGQTGYVTGGFLARYRLLHASPS